MRKGRGTIKKWKKKRDKKNKNKGGKDLHLRNVRILQ